jgi:hypothetical protein
MPSIMVGSVFMTGRPKSIMCPGSAKLRALCWVSGVRRHVNQLVQARYSLKQALEKGAVRVGKSILKILSSCPVL